MAKTKRQRSIILSDETFAALKSIVLARQLAGKRASISSVVEDLIQTYLEEHGAELKNIKAAQLSLFGTDDTFDDNAPEN